MNLGGGGGWENGDIFFKSGLNKKNWKTNLVCLTIFQGLALTG